MREVDSLLLTGKSRSASLKRKEVWFREPKNLEGESRLTDPTDSGVSIAVRDPRWEIEIADGSHRLIDYPYGWAPHQIMTWVGMERYGFQEDAQRLAYRWIYM